MRRSDDERQVGSGIRFCHHTFPLRSFIRLSFVSPSDALRSRGTDSHAGIRAGNEQELQEALTVAEKKVARLAELGADVVMIMARGEKT